MWAVYKPEDGDGKGGGELAGIGGWQPRLATTLQNKVCGIIGLGNIGVEVAKRMRGFGIAEKILYTGRSAKPGYEERTNGPGEFVSLEQLLRNSDLIFVTCSLTPSTRNLLSFSQFDMCKPSAVLVNVARGGIVDTQALVEALQKGKIAAAGLDVTEPEPLPVGQCVSRRFRYF